MDKKWPGVKARQTTIQIWFQWEGERVWETLNWFPSQANLDKAGRLRKRIKTLIEAGSFNYADFFPDSPRAAKQIKPATRFFDVAVDWLKTLSVLEDTKRDYKRILNRHWAPLFPMAIGEIVFEHLNQCIVQSNLNERSPKYFNNEIGPLKQIFKHARKLKIISDNPCDELEYRKLIKEDPDPFDRDEVERIIEYFYRTSMWGEYFEAAFFTGLRNPSEIIALPIPNINFNKKTIRIDQAISRGTHKSHTKTRVNRDVHLNPRAAQAFSKALKSHPTSSGPIFRHPASGNEVLTGEVQNDLWREAMAVLGIRHRPMKNTRHSYATFLLEEGVEPAIAASQMGHSVQVFFTRYAKWINRQKTEEELKKIDRGVNHGVANSVANEFDFYAK